MPNLVGIGNSQVPTNAMLGGLAYQDSVGEIDIEKIKAKTGDTATSIFVYDTSKDSDGGAWRHRTQDRSWYNEPVSETRGARREFPAIAVIVTTQKKVTIYDGDDPNLPMWMHFEFNRYPNMSNLGYTPVGLGHCGSHPFNVHHISSVHALNGFMFIGGNRVLEADSSHTGWDLNFISEVMHEYLQFPVGAPRTSKWKLDGNIAQRNSNLSTPKPTSRYVTNGQSRGILGAVNDVAMTVEPNAPVDPYTKLPVPTTAVATNQGTSIIRGNGIFEGETVVDVVYTGNPDTQYVNFRESDNALVMSMNNNTIYVHVIHEIPTSNKTGSHPYQKEGIDDEFYRTGSSSNWNQSLWVEGGSPASTGTACRIAGNVIAGNGGINVIEPNRQNHTGGMVAEISSTYNSGYMFSDHRGAFLADTDSSTITATTVTSNWATVSNWTYQSQRLTLASDGAGGLNLTHSDASGSYVYAFLPFTVEANTDYLLQVDMTAYNGGALFVHTTQYAIGGSTLANLHAVPGISKGVQFNSGSNTTLYLHFNHNSTSATNIKNIVAQKVLDDTSDRSKSNKDLLVVGTINRAPVAPGAELVSYQPADSSSYLEGMKSTSSLGLSMNFSNAWYMMFWYNVHGKMSLENFSTSAYNNTILMISISQDGFYLRGGSVGTVNLESTHFGNTTGWNQVFAVYNGSNQLRIYKNSDYVHGRTVTISNQDARVILFANSYNGNGGSEGTRSYSVATNAKMALARIGHGEPSQKFITKMYRDELGLFQENAKCTLYGSSSAVTGLAVDNSNNIIHVGTSAGRSEFQGLTRINNTTTAVTTAISASNGFVAEQ